MKHYLVYITCGSKEEGAKIARSLLNERLVACANIYEGVDSLYWWEGKIEEGREAVIIAKTTEKRLDQVIAKVKSLHSYSCPCVVAYKIDAGNPDFLKWIEEETKSG